MGFFHIRRSQTTAGNTPNKRRALVSPADKMVLKLFAEIRSGGALERRAWSKLAHYLTLRTRQGK
jgi:hypothetical protein